MKFPLLYLFGFLTFLVGAFMSLPVPETSNNWDVQRSRVGEKALPYPWTDNHPTLRRFQVENPAAGRAHLEQAVVSTTNQQPPIISHQYLDAQFKDLQTLFSSRLATLRVFLDELRSLAANNAGLLPASESFLSILKKYEQAYDGYNSLASVRIPFGRNQCLQDSQPILEGEFRQKEISLIDTFEDAGKKSLIEAELKGLRDVIIAFNTNCNDRIKLIVALESAGVVSEGRQHDTGITNNLGDVNGSRNDVRARRNPRKAVNNPAVDDHNFGTELGDTYELSHSGDANLSKTLADDARENANFKSA